MTDTSSSAEGPAPRALLSVYDKSGIVAFARDLAELGWDLISSGGTAAALRDAGLPVTEVADLTGAAEMLGGRVKTLHPNVHGGILADRSKSEHLAELTDRGIAPIDLVVSNLYPFRSDPSVELIDIGGPTMVRAAAKNHASVGIVVDPADYDIVLDELRSGGALSDATKVRLARTAFAHTAAYDAAIVTWLDAEVVPAATDEPASALPPTMHLALERVQDLRYGENPHQEGARYREIGTTSWWDGVLQHGGMALSYLNLYDAEAAWRLAIDLGGGIDAPTPAVAIIKHANPCGAATADDVADAYTWAFEADPKSAFGGVVALNRTVTHAIAEAILANPKADVLIAPGFEGGVISRLNEKRKNMRVLESPFAEPETRHYRQIGGGFLVQDPHHFASSRAEWTVPTKAQPNDGQWRDAELAWKICGHVKSNAIVLVKDGRAAGIGAGQQSRVDAGEIAAQKADGRAKGGACASDAFYPFRDGVDAAAAAGCSVVIQPGGSINDDKMVAAADEHGMAMILTGERHFLH